MDEEKMGREYMEAETHSLMIKFLLIGGYISFREDILPIIRKGTSKWLGKEEIDIFKQD